MNIFLLTSIAAVSAMAIGALWYGPLFGKQWMNLMGISKESMEEAKKGGMVRKYALALVGEFLTAYVLWYIINLTGSYALAVMTGLVFWLWLGLYVPLLMDKVLWEDKPWSLLLLNAGYSIVKLLVMGLIIISLV